MQLHTAGRHALAAMLDLALHEQPGPVTLYAIGRRQQVSTSYLEQLFSKLRRHRLVRSTRGPGGGYTLSRPSTEISVGDIISAVDKTAGAAGAGRKAGEPAAARPTDALWSDLNARLMECLESISLRALADEQLAKGQSTPAPPAHRGISSRPVLEPVIVSAPNWVFAMGTAASGNLPADRDPA